MSLKLVVLLMIVAVFSACSSPKMVGNSEHLEVSIVVNDGHEAIYAGIIERARITILGEMHGNETSTMATLALAKDVLDAHGAVTVGVEMPVREQAVLEEYLGSEGSEEDRQKLLASDFWLEDYADGRSSLAMVEFLEALRQMRQAGQDVEILAFDGATGMRGPEALELEMAEPIIAWAEANPERRMVVLVGDFHARLTPVQFGEQTLEPMAIFVVASVDDVVSINLSYDGGTTIARTEAGLEALLLAPHRPAGRRGMRAFGGEGGVYHFEWALEPARPSMPAVSSRE